MIYTGGYLGRQVNSIIDYTHYNNGGGYITYYLCSGNVLRQHRPEQLLRPDQAVPGRHPEQAHHPRVPDCHGPGQPGAAAGRRLYQRCRNQPHRRFSVRLQPTPHFSEQASSYYNDNRGAGFQLGNTTLPTPGVNTVGPRPPATVFFNDFTRTEEEWAIFGELAFDISDSVTVAVSARQYDLTSQLQGASNFSFGCRYGVGGFGNSRGDAGRALQRQ